MFICCAISLHLSVMLMTHSRVMDSTDQLPCGSLPHLYRNCTSLALPGV